MDNPGWRILAVIVITIWLGFLLSAVLGLAFCFLWTREFIRKRNAVNILKATLALCYAAVGLFLWNLSTSHMCHVWKDQLGYTGPGFLHSYCIGQGVDYQPEFTQPTAR